MSSVSIVVPVYHNEASLPALLVELQALAARNSGETFEFVFVDDGSKDRSYEVLHELASNEPRMRLVKLSRNFGSNAAILAGLSVAAGDAVGVIAADLQDPPDRFDEMLAIWRGGRKVILAARSDRDDDLLTTLFANTFYRLFRRYAIKTMPEKGFDFFLIDRRVVDLIKHIEESNAYLMGLILWLGFDPVVIYYKRRARPAHYGRSMWTFTKRIKYFVDSFVGFSYFPVRAASLFGVGLSIAGALYAIVIIVLRLTHDLEVQGWASLMVALLLVSGAQMLMLGILGEYLWRTLDETRRRPRFIIEEIVEPKSSDASRQ